MSMHQSAVDCLHGGPLREYCTCQHCVRHVCVRCGASEGSLTTDCPELLIDVDRLQELRETGLDYTEARGWHLAKAARTPHFATTTINPRTDREADILRELKQKAIAWAVADRACEDQAALLESAREAADRVGNKVPLSVDDHAIVAAYRQAMVTFQLACQHAEECDDAFRQLARRLAEFELAART